MNLITGSTGLIGSHLLLDLLKKGEQVRALKRINSDISIVERVFKHYNAQELFSRISWCDGDILDIPSLEEAMEGVDVVYHCAAVVSFHPKDHPSLFKVNVEGTANVVNTALEAGVKQLCFVSSIAALGRIRDGEKISEKATWKTSPFNTKYAVSKNAAENEVWRGIEEGLNAVIVNPGLVVGPGDKSRSSGELLGRVQRGLSFYPTGTNGFVDVRDVSRAMITLVEKKVSGKRFVLVGENLKFKDFLDQVSRSLQVKSPTIEARPWMLQLAWRMAWVWEKLSGQKALVTSESIRSSPFHFYYDHSRIKSEVGMDFIPLKDSVENAAKFMKHGH